MAAIIRLKRKACDEPADGLVIALKKTKSELSVTNEVLFKFATTVASEKDSIRDHIQAALSKEKSFDSIKEKDLKSIAIDGRNIKSIRDKLQAEHKKSNEKKKLDFLNNRRLVLTEEFPKVEDSIAKDAEARQLFHLYDIIEENEDVKTQNEESENIITCNNEPLIREKIDKYVFDVYIANGHIDQTFIDGTVSVRPCCLIEDDLYFGNSDDSDEVYEDEDDSNDENNWRNEYPEDDDNSKSEKDSSDTDDGSCYDATDYDYQRDAALSRAFNDFDIDEEYEGDESRVFREIRDDDSENEDDDSEHEDDYDC